MKNKLLDIIENYGVNNQQRQFQEETFELHEAITELETFNKLSHVDACLRNREQRLLINHVAEEIADCYVMLEQFRLYFGIDRNQIKDTMAKKINRQLERIENGD